jgi:ATP-dependent HslUV protease subunit HslV
MKESKMKIRSTTVLVVRKDGKVAMAGDGQVTMGNTVMKSNARKVRSIYEGKILCGFAGATADAFTLFEHFEVKIQEYGGDLTRAAVELAKDWRTDRILRKLEALLLVADSTKSLLLSGTGDVIDPAEDAIAIGSGGPYAYAAAMAYLDASKNRGQADGGSEDGYMGAAEIAKRSLSIASGICIYTNDHIIVEEIG